METIIAFVLANKATIALTIPLITRGYYAVKNDGGLVGIWRAVMFGTNSPKEKPSEPTK